MASDEVAQPPITHAFAAAMARGGAATVWCRCGWSCGGDLDASLDELDEHILRGMVIDLRHDMRIEVDRIDVDDDVAEKVEHDIAALDVGHGGYVITCGCGWRAAAEHRDDVSAMWWEHVIEQDAVAEGDTSGG